MPHQHFRFPGKRKSVSEGRLYVNWIPNGETLKNVFVEERVEVCGDSSEEQKTMNATVRITTMAHDDETPVVSINFTQNSIEASHRRCLLGLKENLRSCPGRRNMECRPCDRWHGYGNTQDKDSLARGKKSEPESCRDAPDTTTR